jgi:hypothetical protein
VESGKELLGTVLISDCKALAFKAVDENSIDG